MKLITLVFYFFVVLLGNAPEGFGRSAKIIKKVLKTKDNAWLHKSGAAYRAIVHSVFTEDNEHMDCKLYVNNDFDSEIQKLSKNFIFRLKSFQLVSQILFEADNSPPIIRI